MVLAYKDSPYLEACIQSLLAQTRKSRIIITTSTPNSHIENIVRKYDIEMIVNDHCGSIASDWNFAFNQSPTGLLTLAHQDDIYLPEYGESVIAALNASPDSLIAFTDYEELVAETQRKNTACLIVKRLLLWPFYLKKSWKSTLIKKLILYPGNSICCPAVSFNKSNLEGFEFNPDFTVNLDWDAWLNIANIKGSFTFISRILMQHRLNPDNETAASLRENRGQQEDSTIFLRLWPAFVARTLSYLYALSYLKEKYDK